MKVSARMGGGPAAQRIRHIGPEPPRESCIPRTPPPPDPVLKPEPSAILALRRLSTLKPSPRQSEATAGQPSTNSVPYPCPSAPLSMRIFAACANALRVRPPHLTYVTHLTYLTLWSRLCRAGFIRGQRNPKNLGTNCPEKSDVLVTALSALTYAKRRWLAQKQ
jgi:hypothetical protein